MTDRPLVSIVMPVRNGAAFLAQAIESIGPALGDPAVPHELVVADGGSTDGTRDLVAAYPWARVVSTADDGIYDGLNRAVAAARGDFIVWLNADDLLGAGGIERALATMTADATLGMVSGDAQFLSMDHPPRTTGQRLALSLEGAMFGIPAVNTRMFRRQALIDAGPMRIELGLAADRELLVRLSRRHVRSAPLGAVFYRYRSHPGSTTLASGMAARKRIWTAEYTLAEQMAAEWAADSQTTKLARARRAFTAVRPRIGALMDPKLRGDRSANRVPVAEFFRGLRLHLAWRGRLSGY